MEYRYIKHGRSFIPQIKHGDGEWEYCNNKDIQNSYMRHLCTSLANLHPDTRENHKFLNSKDAKWFFNINDVGEQIHLNGAIFFLEEYLVCAFLGALKQFYNRDPKEFK